LVCLSSCTSLIPKSDLPTLIPTEHLSTVIAMTVQALDSSTPSPTTQLPESTVEMTSILTQTVPLVASATMGPTATPKTTHTPLPPFEIPYADIQFISPGALSKVISPIELHAFLVPGDGGRARVELFGEDGRLMYRKLFVFSSPPDLQTNLRAEIDFEINGVAETGRLVISVDDTYGRLKELASEDLILLSLGDSDINPPGDLLETIIIQEPAPKILIQGNMLVVSGLVRTSSDQPLLVELITTDGKVIGNRLAGIAPGVEGSHRLFATELSYQVYSPTWVRITVSEWYKWLGGPAQLTSVEVLLEP
jgi:hypothetical protein